ncbi:DUF4383 domain-containing protein [Streptomyces sp. TRM64462]|uniref:DUF4383 domain-containing protein n=1 Tax=Streptomyces sp. TRM64462 TaxID=2741726 RepID=UPI001585F695|nr:DUF4383 domain-containing protein [Streptomyces sp. TRM64462]
MAAHRVLHAFRSWRGGRRLPVARAGAGVVGALLVVFGVAGLLSGGVDGFAGTRGVTVAGLGTNGLLGAVCLCAGLVLLMGAALGGGDSGRAVATLDLVAGTAFLVSGFGALALVGTDLNVLAFRTSNVVACFAVGAFLVACGSHGRAPRRGRHPRRGR